MKKKLSLVIRLLFWCIFFGLAKHHFKIDFEINELMELKECQKNFLCCQNSGLQKNLPAILFKERFAVGWLIILSSTN